MPRRQRGATVVLNRWWWRTYVSWRRIRIGIGQLEEFGLYSHEWKVAEESASLG